jgi:hypothetical protein
MTMREKHPDPLIERYLTVFEVASIRDRLGVDENSPPFALRGIRAAKWATTLKRCEDAFEQAVFDVAREIYGAVVGLALGQEEVKSAQEGWTYDEIQRKSSTNDLLVAATGYLRMYELLKYGTGQPHDALRWRGLTPWRPEPEE